MKDNSVRIILKCSTINFLLKNTDEQDSIIISFQRFLNSIDFPIQIMVRSKKLDIDSYLNNLNSRALKQENQLLQNKVSILENGKSNSRLSTIIDLAAKNGYKVELKFTK